MRDLATDGTTVLVSSHLLSEIEQIATHVGMMSAGRLVQAGHADRGARRRGGAAARRRRPTSSSPRRCWPVSASARPSPTDGVVSVRLGDRPVEDVAARWSTPACGCAAWRSTGPALEDLFVAITGEGFDVLVD